MELSKAKQMLTLLWLIAALVVLLSLLFTRVSYGCDDDFYNDLSEREKRIAREMERRYLRNRPNGVVRYKGDALIDEEELISGDVIVVGGTLLVKGEIRGDVLALFGDVELESSALVEGDVVSVDGKVWRHQSALVEGDIVERTSNHRDRRVTYRGSTRDNGAYIEKKEQDRSRRKRSSSWESRFRDDDYDSPVLADYNRVDGFTIGAKLPPWRWWYNRNHNFAVTGKGGYSFASKKWQYQIGFERWFFRDLGVTLGGEIHNMTDTQDRWIIGNEENALAAFLIKEDFRDYYKREGYSASMGQRWGGSVHLSLGYHHDRFENLENKTNWSLFGGDKKFRVNPLSLPFGLVCVDSLSDDRPELKVQSAVAKVTVDTRNSIEHPTRGWLLQACAERAGHEFDSDLEFERFMLDIRRYQPLGWDENLDIRLRAGTATGVLPPMYWYDLGGISTLRGFGFKEFTGDRMVLGNLEYRLNTGDLDLLLDSFDLIFFVDSGCAWFADERTPEMMGTWPLDEEYCEQAEDTEPDETFESLTWASLKTNVGVALASDDGNMRLNFAKRTDRGGSDIVITFRIRKPF